MNKKYIIITSFIILSLILLIFENYKAAEVISEKENKIMQMEMISKNKVMSGNKFGYSDIVNAFDNQGVIEIIKFTQQKGETGASVEIEMLGDIATVEKVLKNVEKKENFQSIQNIKMEKRPDNSIITKLSMNFIKNK